MKILAGVLTILLSCISFNTTAQNFRFYAGGSIGYSDFAVDDDQVGTVVLDDGISLTNITTDIDDTDLGWKFFGGIGFNDYLGLEAGYVDLGKATLDADFTTTITTPPPGFPGIVATPVTLSGTTTVDLSVDGFTVNGVVSYPFHEQFAVFAKAGVFFWNAEFDADITLTGPGITGSGSGSDDDDGTDVTFGVGARYNFYDNFSVRVEWERYSGITEDDGDIDLFSAGIQYNF